MVNTWLQETGQEASRENGLGEVWLSSRKKYSKYSNDDVNDTKYKYYSAAAAATAGVDDAVSYTHLDVYKRQVRSDY